MVNLDESDLDRGRTVSGFVRDATETLDAAKKATHLVCPHCQGAVEFPKPVDNIMSGVFMGLGNVFGNLAASQILTVRQAETVLRKAGYKISKPEKKNGKDEAVQQSATPESILPDNHKGRSSARRR